MDCTDIAEQDVLERYLLHELTESEQDAFEEHYFECKDCFERVSAAKAVQEAHRVEGSSWQEKPLAAYRKISRNWIASLAVLGLVLGAALGTLRLRRAQHATGTRASHEEVREAKTSQTPPSTSADSSIISELGRIDPPPYSPVVLRGNEDRASERFRKAMEHYRQKDYASAIQGLQQVLQMDGNAGNANFYLGACYLLIGKTDLAIPPLQKVISLHDLDYAEQAHYYLAKAFIRNNDMHAAERELELTIQLHGDRESEAGKLKQQVIPRIQATH